MALQTFAERLRLHGKDRFVLWQSAFDFDVPDRVVRDDGGRIPAFETPDEARAYAVTRGLAVGTYPPGVDPTNDLDAMIHWASSPEAMTLDRQLIVDVWMFLEAAEVMPGMSDDNVDAALADLVSQLDTADMAESDRRYAHLAPNWTPEHLTFLAHTLRRGVEAFDALLTSSDAV